MKLLILLIVFCGNSFGLSCGDSDPASLSWAGLSAVLPLGPASTSQNPAWLTWSRRPEAAASAMNLYEIPGLFSGSFGAAMPLRFLHLGSDVSFLSVDSLYREIEWAGGAGASLGPVRFGVSAKVLTMAFAGYHGTYWVPSLTTGGSVKLRGPLSLSLAIDNISNETTPGLAAGLGYIGNDLRVGMEAGWERGFPVTFRFGQEFVLFDAIALRAGMSTEPICFSFGIGLFWKGLEASAAAKTHPVLGLSKSAGLCWFKAR